MPEKTRFKGTHGNKSIIGTLFKELKVCLYLEITTQRDSESVNSGIQQSVCRRKLFRKPIVLGFIPQAGSETDYGGGVRGLS